MKFKASVWFFLIGLISSTASAQTNWVQRFLDQYRPQAPLGAAAPSGALSLTTEDIVRLLLENNRDVVVSRLAPLSSYYAVTALTRTFEPDFHSLITFSRPRGSSRTQLNGTTLSQLSRDYRFGLGQTLDFGTAYNVEFDLNRSSSNITPGQTDPSYNGLATYSLTQPFLRNFGRLPNLRQVRIAQNNQKISEIQFEIQIIDLITQVQQSYWDLVFAGQDVEVKQRSLDLAEKTLHDNRIQVQIGTLAPIDLIQAEAEIATRREDLITAQYTLEQLQDQLKKLITSDTDPGKMAARLHPAEPVHQPGAGDVLPLDRAIAFALENRPELRQASYDIRNREIDVLYTKNQMLPILNVNGSYTQSVFGGGTGVQIIPGGTGNFFNFSGYSFSVNFQIPIRNKAERADFYRALNERDLATQQKSATAQSIALEVRNAHTQVEMNRARVETARTAHELAVRRLNAEQTKFQLGTSTVRFVLEEQRNLAQAEDNEIQALVNYTKALVTHDRAIGNTLQRNNIDIRRQLPKQIAKAN